MKKICTLLLLSFTIINCYAQRYLQPVFSTIDSTLDIVYGSAVNYQGINEVLKLDFYEPSGDIETKRPLIIYAHGGGFTDVNQSKSLVNIVAFCDSFAHRGYAVSSINYRLDTSMSNRAIMNAMYDARAAVRFFKANASTYKIDTSKIFIGGCSAGAITALNVNYVDEPGELLTPAVPPYNTDGTVEGHSGNPGHTSKTAATLCFSGGTKTVLLDPIFDTTVIQHPTDPPLLMVHGTGDPIIPIQYAYEVANRAMHVGLPVVFDSLPGATHCPWLYPLPNSWEYLDSLVDYTATYLYPFVSIVTSISKSTASKDVFRVYPNPVKDQLHVIFQDKQNPVEITIFNTMGKSVLSRQIEDNAASFSINVNALQSGIYFIQAITDQQIIYNRKIIIATD